MKLLTCTIILLVLFCNSNELKCQNKSDIYSINQISNFVDTINIKRYHARVLVTWLYDTIEINTLVHPVKYDLEAMRKFKKDSTFMPTTEEKQRTIDFIKTASQNCYSYALQKYFTYINIQSVDLFNQNNALTRGAFKTIIENTFIKINEFSTKHKKHFKDQINDGTLVVFKNKHNWMIHTFYYENGLFYSKNGGWKEQEYDRMKDIFKRYWDTEFVEFYKIDPSKISEFVDAKS